MAIYHLRLGMVQRSKGQSAVAVAADRARVWLHDERLDQTMAPLPAKRGTVRRTISMERLRAYYCQRRAQQSERRRDAVGPGT